MAATLGAAMNRETDRGRAELDPAIQDQIRDRIAARADARNTTLVAGGVSVGSSCLVGRVGNPDRQPGQETSIVTAVARRSLSFGILCHSPLGSPIH